VLLYLCILDVLLGLVVFCLFEEEGAMSLVCVLRCFWCFVLFVFMYPGCAARAGSVLPV